MPEPVIVREIARALGESATLTEAAPRMLAAVCESLGWEYGALWEVDQGGKTLHCVGTWHASSLQVTEFVEISRTTRRDGWRSIRRRSASATRWKTP